MRAYAIYFNMYLYMSNFFYWSICNNNKNNKINENNNEKYIKCTVSTFVY